MMPVFIAAIDPSQMAAQAANAAEGKSDRWLLIWCVAFCVVLLIIAIIWLVSKIEKLSNRVESQAEAHAESLKEQAELHAQELKALLAKQETLTLRMIEAVTSCAAMLDRTARALEQNWDVLKERLRK